MIKKIKTVAFLLFLGVSLSFHTSGFAEDSDGAAPAAASDTGASGAATEGGGAGSSEGSGGYSLHDTWKTLGLTEKPEYLVGTDPKTTKTKGDASDVTSFFQKIAGGLVTVLVSVAVFFVVLNAFTLVTSAGDTDKVSKAKKALTWIILGILLVIFAYVIVKTIITFPFSAA